jgi:hypothetical protein
VPEHVVQGGNHPTLLAAMKTDWYISWLGNYCERHVVQRPNQPLEHTKYCTTHMCMKTTEFLEIRKLMSTVSELFNLYTVNISTSAME